MDTTNAVTVSSTTRSLASLLKSRQSKTLQYQEMISTRVAPFTLARESHPTLCRSPRPRVSRLLQSPSQRASFYGPVAQVEDPRSSRLVQRNREPCPSPLLPRNPGLFQHQSLHCRMVQVLRHVKFPRVQHVLHLHLRLCHKRVLHHHLNRRSLGTRHCMTLRARVPASLVLGRMKSFWSHRRRVTVSGSLLQQKSK